MVDQRIFIRFPHLLTVMVTLSFLSAIFFIAAPLYMIQLYSNILPARSTETLWVATFFVIIAFIGFWAIERTRLRIASRWTARLDEALGVELEQITNDGAARRRNYETWKTLRSFMNSSGFQALLDLPASLILLAVLAYIHPLLAAFAIAILIVSICLAAISFVSSNRLANEFNHARALQENLARNLTVDSAILLPKQSRERLWTYWLANEKNHFYHQQLRHETIGSGNTIIKSSRIAAQSMLLGLGALLIIRGDMSMATLLAASVLGARALAPYDALAQSFGSLQTAWVSRKKLKAALRNRAATPLEQTIASTGLEIKNVRMALPGTRTYFFNDLSLYCPNGTVTLLAGPSGAGKSALLALSAGSLNHQQGKIARPQSLSYQPLQARFLDATIIDNIANLNHEPDAIRLKEILTTFGIEEDLAKLELNLTTKISVTGCTQEGRVLPSSFLRKLVLARSLIEDPDLIIWDQPFNGLDRTTRELLSQVIARLKEGGKTIILTADPYPSSLKIDQVVMMKNGKVQKSGPASSFFNQTAEKKTETNETTEKPRLKMVQPMKQTTLDRTTSEKKRVGAL